MIGSIPEDVRNLLEDYPRRLFVAGGAVRCAITGEAPGDIDLFGEEEVVRAACAGWRSTAEQHVSERAITVQSPGRLPVQFITGWSDTNAEQLLDRFDFRCCQAAAWRSGKGWASVAAEGFYEDLAGRRLFYTSRAAENDDSVGGTLARVVAMAGQGWKIDPVSLAAVAMRFVHGAEDLQEKGSDMTPADAAMHFGKSYSQSGRSRWQ